MPHAIRHIESEQTIRVSYSRGVSSKEEHASSLVVVASSCSSECGRRLSIVRKVKGNARPCCGKRRRSAGTRRRTVGIGRGGNLRRTYRDDVAIIHLAPAIVAAE